MSFTDFIVHEWLDVIAEDSWASLHYDSPALDTVSYNEISGGGYGRVACLFQPPGNRTIWTDSDLTWSGLPRTIVTHFGIWNAKFGGNLVAYGPLPKKQIILEGNGYVLVAGDLALSIA